MGESGLILDIFDGSSSHAQSKLSLTVKELSEAEFLLARAGLGKLIRSFGFHLGHPWMTGRLGVPEYDA